MIPVRCDIPRAIRAPQPGAHDARWIETGDARADGRRRIVGLGQDRVVIARRIAGISMRIALPPSAFRGVVLRIGAPLENAPRYEIRLAHRDPDLSVTLLEAADDLEVQAEWRSWARFLGLPALMERDGEEASQAASVAAPRRRGKTMAARRARFLTRRKMGRPEREASCHTGSREIFGGSGRDR